LKLLCTQRSFSFRCGIISCLFTDTNSVICKIIVGADAYIRPRVDVGIDPYEMSVKEIEK